MDDRERGLVEAELTRLDADPDTRRWVARVTTREGSGGNRA